MFLPLLIAAGGIAVLLAQLIQPYWLSPLHQAQLWQATSMIAGLGLLSVSGANTSRNIMLLDCGHGSYRADGLGCRLYFVQYCV